MKLWQGRLSGDLDEAAAQLNNSLEVDQRLAEQDVRASIAWAQALQDGGVLTEEEAHTITNALDEIAKEFAQGSFAFQESDEDIHTALERRLTERIGALGGKLHTGRSRNDQVTTDFRLWVKENTLRIANLIGQLQTALLARAEGDLGILMPGYTHLQQAQPILLSHWWLSHFWALQRDRTRLQSVVAEADILPLGCAALAGTAYPIDRFKLAEALGFSQPAPNSIDAVSDRDFAVSFVFASAMIGVHLSRLAEQLILFSTREFGFFELAEAFSTGSSIMPQKKNPDPLEIIRSKSGFFSGRLTGLLGLLKALPSAYDKDLQDDKPPVFECADTLSLILPVMAGVVTTLSVNVEKMEAALDPALMATDLADHLVTKGVPFREAYGVVGLAVRAAYEKGIPLNELPLETWQVFYPGFDNALYALFDPQASTARRSAWGGTAESAVRKQIELAKREMTCVMC